MGVPSCRRRRVDARPSPDPARVVIRRRRCRESSPSRSRRRGGRMWRQLLCIVLTVLAAKPAWSFTRALVVRYHEEIADVARQTGGHLNRVRVGTPEAAPSGPYAQGAPATNAFASAWRRWTSSNANPKATVPAATVDPSAHGTAATSVPARASWASAGRAAPAHFAGHADRRSSVAAAQTPAPSQTPAPDGLPRANPVFTWNAVAASTAAPGTSGTYWTGGGNWDGGVAPKPAANEDIQFRNARGDAASSTVDQNYTIHGLTFLPSATAYTLGGSSGVSLTINDGGLTQSSPNAQTINVPIVLGADQTWHVAAGAGALAVNGSVSGTGNLTKTGAGTLILSAYNPYTGSTTVDAGTLQAGSDSNVFGGTSAVTMADVAGATLDLNGHNATIGSLAGGGANGGNVTLGSGILTIGTDGSRTTYAGIISGTGGINKTGTGTLTLAGANTYTGSTSVDTGTLVVTGTVGVPNPTASFSVDRGVAELDAGGSLSATTTTVGAVFNATFNQKGGTQTISGDLYLGLTVTGNGTFNLSGGTLTAHEIVHANTGTFNFGTGTFNFNGGTLRVGAASANFIQGLTAANVQAGGAILDTNGFDATVGQPLVHDPRTGAARIDGGLTKNGAGTLTLAASNTYTGTTTVSAGALLATNTSGSATGTGSVFVGPGARLGGTGSIGGNLAVGVQGTFNPPAGVSGAGRAVDSGVLAPGVNGPGIFTVVGSLTFASSGTLEADLAGSDPGAGYDQVKVGGGLSLAGSLTLTLAKGTPLAVGQKFYIFDLTSTAGTVTGTFENGASGGVFVDNAGNRFQIKYNDVNLADGNDAANDVSLTALPVPEPGTWVMCGLGAAVAAVVMATRRRVGG